MDFQRDTPTENRKASYGLISQRVTCFTHYPTVCNWSNTFWLCCLKENFLISTSGSLSLFKTFFFLAQCCTNSFKQMSVGQGFGDMAKIFYNGICDFISYTPFTPGIKIKSVSGLGMQTINDPIFAFAFYTWCF